jgi:hypothetical protein
MALSQRLHTIHPEIAARLMCSGKWNIYLARTSSRMPASLALLGIASIVGICHLAGGLLKDAS